MFDSIRILIVDDDSDMQSLLQCWLEPAGYQIVSALDGEKAMNAFSASRFDLTLVDYSMPKMNGMQVLEQIADRHIAVGPLLLTASNDVGLIVEAMRRGALDCLVKPTPPKDLLVTLNESLERHWANQLGLPPLPAWRGHDLSLVGNSRRLE